MSSRDADPLMRSLRPRANPRREAQVAQVGTDDRPADVSSCSQPTLTPPPIMFSRSILRSLVRRFPLVVCYSACWHRGRCRRATTLIPDPAC